VALWLKEEMLFQWPAKIPPRIGQILESDPINRDIFGREGDSR
jgi:hypothetical protein